MTREEARRALEDLFCEAMELARRFKQDRFYCAADFVADHEAEIDAILAAVPEWRACKERLPDLNPPEIPNNSYQKSDEVLIVIDFGDERHIEKAHIIGGHGWLMDCEGHYRPDWKEHITHWQPLPEPPEEHPE